MAPHDKGNIVAVIRLLAVILVVVMSANALAPQPASAIIRGLTKQELKDMCAKAGGQYHERSDGSYQCDGGNGYFVECGPEGGCYDVCYEDFGCTCTAVTTSCVPKAKPIASGNDDLGDLFQRTSANIQPTAPATRSSGPILPAPPLNTPGGLVQNGPPHANGSVTVNLLGCPSGLDLATATYSQLAADCQQPLGGVPIGLAHISDTAGTIDTLETSAQPPAQVVFADVAPGSIRLVASYPGDTSGMVAFCGAYAPQAPGPTDFARYPVSISAMQIALSSGNSLYCDWFVGLGASISGANHHGVGTSPSSSAGQTTVAGQFVREAATPVVATPAS